MKTIPHLLIAGTFLATLGTGLGQCDISITTQPQNQTCCVGTTATLAVAATGTEALAYQWQLSPETNSPSPAQRPVHAGAQKAISYHFPRPGCPNRETAGTATRTTLNH